jgi:hypothetical protein
VCPLGQLTFEKNVSQPMPGETYATIQWYCADASSAERTALDYSSVFLPAGLIYGLLVCFPLFVLARYFFKRWDDALDRKYAEEKAASQKRR